MRTQRRNQNSNPTGQTERDTAVPDRQRLIDDTKPRGRPPMPEAARASSLLTLRITRQEKAAYVRAARPGTLAAWVLRQLRKASGYEPKPDL